MSRPADISYPTICSEDTLSIRILSSSSDCRSLDIFSMTIVPFAVFVENTLMMFGWQSGISLSRNKPGGGGRLMGVSKTTQAEASVNVPNHWFESTAGGDPEQS